MSGFTEITYVSDCNDFAKAFANESMLGNSVRTSIKNIDYSKYIKNMNDISAIAGNADLTLN